MSNIESIHTSRYAIGEQVHVAGQIKAVHFTESKVHYIVEIGGHLFNVDSCDVHPLPVSVDFLLGEGNTAGILAPGAEVQG